LEESVDEKASETPGQVSPALAQPPPQVFDQQVIQREERIEYRDADGNVLDDDDVELLKGKVSFEVS
jgi:hypothetical protein